MFAVIELKSFALQAALRWRDVGEGAAVALVDADAQKGEVVDMNGLAADAGVYPGIPITQAMARCPRLVVLTRASGSERACEAILHEVAASLTPDIERTAPGVCTLDWRRIGAGMCWQQLAERARDALALQGLAARVGVARNPDHARLAARVADGVSVIYDGSNFCAHLPLDALDPSAEFQKVVRGWGVERVGDLLRLPREGVVARLGAEADMLWQRATGRRIRPLDPIRPVTRYEEAFDFEYEVSTVEPLLFLLRRFLDALTARLRRNYRVAEGMRLTLRLDDGSETGKEFRIPAPTTDGNVLFRILDTYLEGLQLNQSLVGVQLVLDPADAHSAQLDLFEVALRDMNGFGEMIARIEAIVGRDAVGSPRKSAGRCPGALTLEQDLHRLADPPAEYGTTPAPLGLPLRRFRPVRPVRVELVRGIPARIESPDFRGAVREVAGPYRVSGDWWEADRHWAVEEWDVQLEFGDLLRITRRASGWACDGTYDRISHARWPSKGSDTQAAARVGTQRHLVHPSRTSV